MFTNDDLSYFSQKGIAPEEVERQLGLFRTGFPYLRLLDSASIGHGIITLSDDEVARAEAVWAKYLADGGEVIKFVPASGAASRMFKALYAFVNGEDERAPEGSPVAALLEAKDRLPFRAELDAALRRLYGRGLDEMIAAGEHKKVISALINPEGLNYGNLPKGLLTFHEYDDTTRTPLEEHLMEGAQTAAADGRVKLHFTVSANHRKLFEDKLAVAIPRMEALTGLKYDVSLSEQKPSTDTVAATADNQPFREDNGRILFRPGGHGSLIANLGDIDEAVVFIKNIDNVVPDRLRADTVRYKKALAGLLIEVHRKLAAWALKLADGNYTDADLDEMKAYMRHTLSIDAPELDTFKGKDLARWIAAKFNRPLRVCGVVRNEGEPGGGPFLAYNADGSSSPQILESTQIDMNRPEYAAMMAKATHFNPVDLVCYIKDFDGRKFELPAYVDETTGFISSKSQNGRELRALERPGLWNGAMSDWTTLFVEVPASTFNPVKTVNDLLRPAHQK